MKSKLFVSERLIKGEWIPLELWVDQSFRNLLKRLSKTECSHGGRLKRIKTLEEYKNLDKTNVVNVPTYPGWLGFIEWTEVPA